MRTPKSWSVEELAQRVSSKSIFNPEVDTRTGTTPTRIAGWSITAYLISVAVTGILTILLVENAYDSSDYPIQRTARIRPISRRCTAISKHVWQN